MGISDEQIDLDFEPVVNVTLTSKIALNIFNKLFYQNCLISIKLQN